jgi:hypothetical protein
MGMKSSTKMHAGGLLMGALVVLIVGLASPLALAYVPWSNESGKRLEADVPLLDPAELDESDLKVSYTYRTDEAQTKSFVVPTGAVSAGEGASLDGAFDVEDLFWINIDLGHADVETKIDDIGEPAYKAASPFDHFVVIELPIKADAFWEDSIREWCLGFSLTRGHDEPDKVANQQSYRVELGSGTAVLYQTTVAPDKDTGDADTNKLGTCRARADVGDNHPEFGSTLNVEDVQSFLLSAYVNKDAKKPEPVWLKVYGPRAVNETAEELGDTFDLGVQFYTWPATANAYNDLGAAQMVVGGLTLVFALIMTTVFAVPFGDIKGHIHKERKSGREF